MSHFAVFNSLVYISLAWYKEMNIYEYMSTITNRLLSRFSGHSVCFSDNIKPLKYITYLRKLIQRPIDTKCRKTHHSHLILPSVTVTNNHAPTLVKWSGCLKICFNAISLTRWNCMILLRNPRKYHVFVLFHSNKYCSTAKLKFKLKSSLVHYSPIFYQDWRQ